MLKIRITQNDMPEKWKDRATGKRYYLFSGEIEQTVFLCQADYSKLFDLINAIGKVISSDYTIEVNLDHKPEFQHQTSQEQLAEPEKDLR